MSECARFYRSDVPESIWKEVYSRLRDAGRLKDSFPAMGNCSFDDFLNSVARPDRFSWVLTFRKELAGVVYLTDMEGTSARIHFAFLPTTAMRSAARLPVPVTLGRFAVASLLRDKSEDKYILDTVVGLTPADNRAAVKMITRCGAYVLGEIPGVCRLTGHERNRPGIVTYFTRETTESVWCDL